MISLGELKAMLVEIKWAIKDSAWQARPAACSLADVQDRDSTPTPTSADFPSESGRGNQKCPQCCREFHDNSSERPSSEPLLKKEATPTVLSGREFWKCLEFLGWGVPSCTLEGNSIGRTPRGSCNRTLLRRILRSFSTSRCVLEGFLEGAW